MIYPFLKDEFFLQWKDEELDLIIDKKINILRELNFISSHGDKFVRSNFKTKEFYELQALGRLVQPSIDRFYVLILQLWKNQKEHISKNDLEKKSLKILKNLEKTHSRLTPEFSERWMFDVFLSRLIDNRYVKEDKDGMVYATRVTQKLKDDAIKFLEPKWLNELTNSGS
jgi:glycerol-3-phosphate O-acyltransferase